ncbi:hypothetical protein FCH28_34845 [Streptomyces piniterrae]|uniref:Pycsar effector protein domain-containing protein n=1 Tax=Streptomyces piniterrae TaxID=2571125 RepID=A0A4U0MN54_9ACTN|nr:Pycsar system effector family protein [Streptomyces piniterrae]TJZ42200.1 hypothetical protein FCH28_34845 [Streptomyces piniterrae]
MAVSRGDGEASRGDVLARLLLAETREEMLKADQKAGFMLSCLGVAVTALIGAVSAGGITPLRYGPVAQSLFWAGCAALPPALSLLGLAIVPRTGPAVRQRAHYFGDVPATVSTRRLASLVRRTDPLERHVSQFAVLSQAVTAKYRCIRRGMVCAAVFYVLTALGVVLGALG